MEILYYSENKTEFWEYWESYLKDNIHSYRYLKNFIEYMLAESKYLTDNHSFVILENGKCVAIAYIPIESHKQVNTISHNLNYTIAPLSLNSRIEKKVFENIDQIVKECNIEIIRMKVEPIVSLNRCTYNPLIKYKYVDSSSSDNVINLGLSDSELWSNIRKGHKYDINQALKNENLQVSVIDHNNLDHSIHDEYKKMHEVTAGKKTRSDITFKKQLEMLKHDEAIIVALKDKDIFVGINYFFHNNSSAIYASGADNPEYNTVPISHLILWKAIKYYKEKGLKYLQMSYPVGYSLVDGFNDYYDEKQLNIAKFKRGFGGMMCTVYRGSKYLNSSCFVDDIEAFKKVHKG